ncbi:MAG TPA: hypothetical protein VM911_14430 [Pyrinomonadaceae bacterium]|jgi:hypothetical protein|nr:hypothetical protein [Pyrinomonadaceae bacterium]
MRRLSIVLVSAFVLSIASALISLAAQGQTFTSENVDYTLELPSTAWRVVQEADSVHQHTEFIYGDRTDGHLKIRKEVVDEGTTASDLAKRDQEQKLRFIPGYVDGKEERFAGRLNGVTISYEFTSGGKPMAGRTYYLQADNRTIYALRFTALRDKLSRIRNQTDLIARSFQTKQ